MLSTSFVWMYTRVYIHMQCTGTVLFCLGRFVEFDWYFFISRCCQGHMVSNLNFFVLLLCLRKILQILWKPFVNICHLIFHHAGWMNQLGYDHLEGFMVTQVAWSWMSRCSHRATILILPPSPPPPQEAHTLCIYIYFLNSVIFKGGGGGGGQGDPVQLGHWTWSLPCSLQGWLL